MAIEKNIVKEQLQALGDFHQFFTAKEIRYLPQILTENETIQGITSGYYEAKTWLIVITNIRLLFLDTGLFFRLRQTDIPLSKINSISYATGLFFGEIEIATGSEVKTISSITKKDVLKIVSIISGLIHSGSRSSTPRDLTSQLERLAALCDKGILTEKEFERCKEKLLEDQS